MKLTIWAEDFESLEIVAKAAVKQAQEGYWRGIHPRWEIEEND